MKKRYIDKILVVGFILLFIGAGVSPAFASVIKKSTVVLKDEDCIECNQASAVYLVKMKWLQNKVKVYNKLLLVFSK